MLSNKQIVKVNGYLKTSDFTTDEQTSHLFKWARTSSECKKVKEINQEFNARVNLTKIASLQAKEQLKKKKTASHKNSTTMQQPLGPQLQVKVILGSAAIVCT